MNKIIFSLVLYRHSLKDIIPLLKSINELHNLYLTKNENRVFLSIYDNTDDLKRFKLTDFKFLNLPYFYKHDPKNVGFGVANNLNFKNYNVNDQDIFIISNPDTSFEASKLIKLIDYFQSQKEIVCANPLIKNPRNTIQYSAKNDPTVLSLMIGFLPIFLKLPFFNNYDFYHKNKNFNYLNQTFQASYLSGCFLVVKAQVFKKVQGFSPAYFLHLEDADFVRRCSRYGITAHIHLSEIKHLWNRGSHKSCSQIMQVFRSMIIYFYKWGLKIF